MSKKAAIVGSGVAGLATAIRLAVMGYEVEVFEANNTLGGKIGSITVEGFKFDTGPCVLIMPNLIDELYTFASKDPKQHFTYQQLDVVAKYFYEDGTTINAFAEPQKFAEEVATKTGEPASNILAYLERSKGWFEASKPFSDTELSVDFSTLFSTEGLDVLQLMANPATRQTVAGSTTLFKDKRVAALFEHYVAYSGSDAAKAPAIANTLPYIEQQLGAYVPVGDMQNITQSLVELGKSIKVKYHTGVKIDAILFDKKKAWGIGIAGEDYLYDIVVSNVDITQTYRQLMRAVDEPKELSRPLSHSAMIFYWGIGKLHPELQVKNVFLSASLKEESKSLAEGKTIYNDPTIHLTITSKYNPADAPAGAENWMVMVHVPNNTGQNWKTLRKQMESHVLAKLSRILGDDISKRIIADDAWDPATLQVRTNTYKGAAYGSSGNSIDGIFNRHRNFHSHLSGIYFCGGTVHPGPGVASCLQSAKIVADLIEKWETRD